MPNQTPLPSQPARLTAAILLRHEGAESWICPDNSVGPADLVVAIAGRDPIYCEPLRGGERNKDADTFQAARQQLAEAGYEVSDDKWSVIRRDNFGVANPDGHFAGWTTSASRKQ